MPSSNTGSSQVQRMGRSGNIDRRFDFYQTCVEKKTNMLVYLHLGAYFHTCLGFITGDAAIYLLGISPTYFASFSQQFASFPHQNCFIYPKKCCIFPTVYCISPTNGFISPTVWCISPCNVVSFCQQKIRTQFYQIFSIVFPYWGQHFLWNVSKENHSSRHSIRPCLFSGRQFEKTFENTQWGTVEQM